MQPEWLFPTPDFVAYLPSTVVLDGVGDALAANGAHVVTAWQAFLDSSIGASAVVVVLPDLTTPMVERLVMFKHDRPLVSTLLVTSYHRENVRCLKDIAVEGLLFLDELPTQIVRALRQLGRESPLHRAAESVRALPHLDADLAEVLGRACTRSRPLRHVAELAAMLGYDRTTLTRRWNQFIAPPSHPHLFIDWLLVTHALLLRSAGNRSWTLVATELGVKDRTLQEATRRVFRRTLKQLVPLHTHDVLVALGRILGAGDKEPFARLTPVQQEPAQCSISVVPGLAGEPHYASAGSRSGVRTVSR